MNTVLLSGSMGMLGQDLSALLKKNNYKVIETDIHNMDITNLAQVKEFLNNNPCDIVIHTAAYTNVDGAESDSETAFRVNEKGTENLALITGNLNIPMVYISTDYVFDGKTKSSYLPNDETCPLNVYGASKLAGESALKKLNPKHYICRTSWLYGAKGNNFVETMIALAKEKSELSIVSDQFGCPTWTIDLSNAILRIFLENRPYGVYHTCGGGKTSWYGFAKKIFELSNIDISVLPVLTQEFARPAKRPAYSVMDNGGLCRNWEEALTEYLKIRKQ